MVAHRGRAFVVLTLTIVGCAALVVPAAADYDARVECMKHPKQIPSCCDSPKVDVSTIRVEFIVRDSYNRTFNLSSWQLDAAMSWTRPQGNYFDAYVVRTGPSTNNDKRTCSYQNGIFKVANNESIILEDLPFGHQTTFHIATANTSARTMSRYSSSKRESAPDCYEATKSVDFCKIREVPVAGNPLELSVVSITAGTLADYAKVRVSWYPPAQMNRSATLVEFNLQAVIDVGDTQHFTLEVPPAGQTYDDPFEFPYFYIFENLQMNTTVEIKVQAIVTFNKTLGIPNKLGPVARVQVLVVLDENVTSTESENTSSRSVISHRTSSLAVVLASASLVVVVLVIAVTVLAGYTSWRKRKAAGTDSLQSFQRYPTGNQSSGYKSAQAVSAIALSELPNRFSNMEFQRSNLTLESRLGSGSFGVVYKGYAYCSMKGKLDYYPVAVKGLRENASRASKEDFLDEIELVIEIGSHPNILSVLGCCTVDEPYHLITEFMAYGDLLHYLWKCKDIKMAIENDIYRLTETNQLQIARQVARGMEYISKTHYYHGDLAARNVLVGEGLIVKLSDFGMADDIYQSGYKRLAPERKRPIKWVSLETNTTGKCSHESDVWSFGIVLYEIYTKGDAPYPGLDNGEVIEKLKSGYRMDRPVDCPAEIIMSNCWLEEPTTRPTFTQLFNHLDEMLSRQSDYAGVEETYTENEVAPILSQPNDKAACEAEDELLLWRHLRDDTKGEGRTVGGVPPSAEQSTEGAACCVESSS